MSDLKYNIILSLLLAFRDAGKWFSVWDGEMFLLTNMRFEVNADNAAVESITDNLATRDYLHFRVADNSGFIVPGSWVQLIAIGGKPQFDGCDLGTSTFYRKWLETNGAKLAQDAVQ